MNNFDLSLRILRQQLFESLRGFVKVNELPPVPKYLEESIRLFRENNSWWTHEDGDQGLKAYLGFATAREPFFGMSIQRCLFRYDWNDPGALSWMLNTLKDHLPAAHNESYFQLFPVQHELWPIMRSKGYGISEVAFGGFPDESLERLKRHYRDRPAVSLSQLGLRLEPLIEIDDLPAIFKLRDEVFTSEPERFWPYKNPGVADADLNQVQDRMTSGHQWKISREGQILGMFGFGPSARNLFSKEVGLDFAFHQSLHGLGLGRLAYETMLPLMIDEGIGYYSGSTANPAVVHLARVMGRPVEFFHIRARSQCPDQNMFAHEKKLLGSPS